MSETSWLGGTTPLVFVKPIGIAAADAMRLLEMAKRIPMPVRWRLAPVGVAADVYIAHQWCVVESRDAATLPVDSKASGWAASSAELEAIPGEEPSGMPRISLDDMGYYRARPVCVLGGSSERSVAGGQELAPLRFPEALREMERELSRVLPDVLGTRMLFTIGALAWEQRSRWPSRSLHAMEGSELIAVVDTQNWRLYLRDDCTVDRMARATLLARPHSGGFAADGFHPVKLEAALWEFAKRCPEEALGDMLPSDFLNERLTHRRMITMKKHALGEHCVAILRALEVHSHTADELKANLRMSHPAMMRALTCLALVRAIQPEPSVGSGLLRKFARWWRKFSGKAAPYSARHGMGSA